MSSILDLDVLLTRIASLTKRLIDYRTFGILLLNDATSELEMKLAVRYGEEGTAKNVKLGEGLVGWSALHKEPVLVADVSKDPRYINLVDDVRSELVIPMLIKERCIGVFDLESPELNAFTKEHKELLTLLASQAAVAIENARLYEEVRRNEERIEKELRFAQRVQAALLPTEPPTRLRNADVAGRFAPAHELGGDLHDFIAPEPNSLVVAVGDVSGKGAPAALYGAFAAELVRSRTVRRRYTPDKFSVAGVLQSMNTILHDRQLEEYYCTLCYAFFDFKRRAVTLSNSGLPYPDSMLRRRVRTDRAARRAARVVPGRDLRRGRRSRCMRATSSCSARTASSRRRAADGKEFGAKRLCDVVDQTPQRDRARDRRRNLRRRHRVPRRRAAGRRHDRGRGEDHRMNPNSDPKSNPNLFGLGLPWDWDSSIDLALRFVEVQPERLAAERRQLVHPPLHVHARALRRARGPSATITVI